MEKIKLSNLFNSLIDCVNFVEHFKVLSNINIIYLGLNTHRKPQFHQIDGDLSRYKY